MHDSSMVACDLSGTTHGGVLSISTAAGGLERGGVCCGGMHDC